jgi:hypothetical protein
MVGSLSILRVFLFKSVTGKTHFAYFKTILYIVYHTETSLVNEFDILLSKAEGGHEANEEMGFSVRLDKGERSKQIRWRTAVSLETA